jgi:hypothetical protein
MFDPFDRKFLVDYWQISLKNYEQVWERKNEKG